MSQALQVDLQQGAAADPDVAAFYAKRRYKPLWTARGRLRPEAEELVTLLADAGREGLRPADYRPEQLRSLITAAEFGDPDALAAAELALTRAYAAYVVDLRQPRRAAQMTYTDPAVSGPNVTARSALAVAGKARSLHGVLDDAQEMNPIYAGLRDGLADYRARWSSLPQTRVPPGATLAEGAKGPRVKALRQRLGLPAAGGYDRRLTEAVTAFQSAHGLAASGHADAETIAALNLGARRYEDLARANLARARALPADLGRRFILVDVAAQQLWLYENGKPTQSMKVVVGKPATATPAMVGVMRYALFNPYWNVPPDLVRERVAVRYLKEGQAYFDGEGMEALSDWTDAARPIDPRKVDWKAVAAGKREVRVRQKPGAHNMMGQVKLMLPNELGIYLHDTPNRELFAEAERAFSAGCVRLERAVDLASAVVGSSKAQAALAAGGETRVNLAKPLPVYIAYLTATPAEAGGLTFHHDIYGRDAPLLASLDGRPAPKGPQVAAR